MREELEKLIEVARKWGSLTAEDGVNHKCYAGGYIGCYHAEKRDHIAVKLSSRSNEIEIKFHRTPTIVSTVEGFVNIEMITKESSRLYEEEVKSRGKKSQKKKLEEREAKVKALKEQLAILEGDQPCP